MPASTTNVLLRLRGIHKRFPGVHALRGIDLEIRAAEVHAIVGENGAGKSTLVQILAGVYQPDDGRIWLDGVELTGFADESAAQRAGVAIVFQERSLFAPLSIAENIFAGRQPTGRFGGVDRQRLRSESKALLERVGLRADPDAAVETLSPAEQQLVEVAKALSLNARILILDEPTAALTPTESANLFQVVRELTRQSVAVIYISHRLEEVFAISQRVSVLKDGEWQGTFPIDQVTPATLVRMMVGRNLCFERPADRTVDATAPVVLEVRRLNDGEIAGRVKLRDIHFQVRAGEILGIAGLVGSGRTETALALIGARPGCQTEVFVDQTSVRIRSPREAIAAGVGYVPEDRKQSGLFLDMGIARNIATGSVPQFGSLWIDDAKQRRTVEQFRQSLRINSRNCHDPVRTLSGGNQQKVLLSRWLLVDPRVLVVDEPTRGIDIGSKSEIHSLLFDLARRGRAIIVISSDLPEVIALADRAIVLYQGRVAGELSRGQLTEENLVRLSSGVA